MADAKQLSKIKYPDDFIAPEMKVLSDKDVNTFIQDLVPTPNDSRSAGNMLVVLTDTGYIEVYCKVAECEVEVDW